jgi:putative aldouronate transport system substrate-binding protein
MKKLLVILLVAALMATPLFSAAADMIPLKGTGSSPEDPLFDPALGLTLTVYTTNGWNEDAKPDNDMVKAWIEERTGLKLNFVYTSADNFVEKMNLMFVSGEPFDAFTVANILTTRPLQSLYDDNLILDITPYLDTYGKNLTKYLGDGYSYCMGKDGQILSIPKRVSNHRGNTPTIRADWAEKAGLPGLPTTIAELEQYFDYVLKNDCNGNGDPNDEIPLLPTGPNGFVNLATHWKGVFMGKDGIGDRYLAEDGTVHRDCDNPNYMAFLDKMREWYQKGYLYSEFFTVTSSQVNDMVTADRAGMLNQWYSNQVRPFRTVEEADSTKHYEILPTIASPVDGVVSMYSEGNTYQPVIQVSSSSEHPEVAVAYFDWTISNPDINSTVWNGIKGTHWNWADEKNFIFTKIGDSENRYFKGFQAVCQWDAEDQFLYAEPNDYISIKYDHYLKDLNGDTRAYAEAFDLKVPYNKVGTELEFMSNDAETLLQESVVNYIIGMIDRDAMVNAIKEYDAIYGDVYSKVYTEQYNAWLAKQQ